MSDIQTAKRWAEEKHAGLIRTNKAKQPFIEHIAEVADLVKNAGGSDIMVMAAWLHDIVEDTDVTMEQVFEIFGEEVGALVDGLTDPDHFAALPLQERKSLQAVRLRQKPDAVKRIKICDQLSNILFVLHDPPLDWDAEMQFSYIHGAKIVADICHGLSPELDAEIEAAYARACLKFNREKLNTK